MYDAGKNIFLKLLIKTKIIGRSLNKIEKIIKMQMCAIFVKKDLNNDKVWDHCHISGKYRGAAHDNCKKIYVVPKYILIVFHNLRGYDSHLIVQKK